MARERWYRPKAGTAVLVKLEALYDAIVLKQGRDSGGCYTEVSYRIPGHGIISEKVHPTCVLRRVQQKSGVEAQQQAHKAEGR